MEAFKASSAEEKTTSLGDLRKELEGKHEEEVNGLNDQIKSLKDNIGSLQTEIENLKISSAADKTTALGEQKQELKEEHKKVVDELHAQIATLNGNIVDLKSQMEDLKMSHTTDKATSLDNLKGELEGKHSKELEELRTQISDLERSIEELKVSHEKDKKAALGALTAELDERYQREIIGLRGDHNTNLSALRLEHETEVSRLRDAHQAEVAKLSVINLPDELRLIKKQMAAASENDLKRAIEQAKAEQRAMMIDEIRSLQASHTATLNHERNLHQEEVAKLRAGIESEKQKVIQDAIERFKAEHAAETAMLVTRQREELVRKSGTEMRTLSDAHSAKTASLENEIAQARAAQQVAEAKAKKALEFEHIAQTNAKELAEAQKEVEELKKKVKELEVGAGKYISLFEAINDSVRAGEETPLSELD